MYQPSYNATSEILDLVLSIGEYLGLLRGASLEYVSPQLRKTNRIKSIQSSLAIEGNRLSEAQVTALINGKRVVGPVRDILEARNAIQLYASIYNFDPLSEGDLLKAHGVLMEGLIEDAGKYRFGDIGVFDGAKPIHVAPPAGRVPLLMQALFSYLKNSKDNLLIRSCVFHYEFEFVHPFSDGNGRMGRFWQSVILKGANPIFASLPIETVVKERQQEYYLSIQSSTAAAESSPFIVFMLEAIQESLRRMISVKQPAESGEERLLVFKAYWDRRYFSRKDYLNYHKNISPSTATRDLRQGVNEGVLSRKGENRTTTYTFAP